MTPEQTALLRDLLDAHIINLEGHIAAIELDPALAAVADEGVEQLTRELDVAQSAYVALG